MCRRTGEENIPALSFKCGDSQLRCAGVQAVTPALLRSLGGEIPPPVTDAIKQGYDGSVKHGLERKISMEGLQLIFTALLAFIFAQNLCVRHLKVTVTV